ncbi:FMN-dependent NADH-azoreductase [Novosphingobium terrae]|uniref:FMN-dependent NADH-azoreductase n=1 Tax=Novosphingobium terrae TaxID=2726189 RepID=UPI001980AA86|nr:NAD(P)H-dependent oxidoreductase [Novosphingobium terrae]
MSQILHLTCSPRGAESHSTALSTAIVQRIIAARPDASHIRCDLGAAPPEGIDGPYASALVAGQAETGFSSPALDRSAAAIAELAAADMLVIGTPMHNFTVPAALKAWIDLVVRPFHTFVPGANGKVPLLPGRPVFVAIASGGHFHGEGAAQPDFLTPHLLAVLGCIGLRSVHFLPLQRTARATANDLEQQTHVLLNRVDDILRHMGA